MYSDGSGGETDSAGQAVLDVEVAAMLEKAAIRVVDGNPDGVVSPFFARPKATPGKWRPIVSLKKVNEHIRYQRFRMTTVRDIKLWVREGHFFSSIDLSDAYFSIPLHQTVWRFIRFVWRDLTYEFMVNMFGLGPSARLFTKVLAVVIRFLRNAFEMLIQGYIDDFLIQALTSLQCEVQTHIAIIVFHVLGFKVNFEKSSLRPSTAINHLGFDWDSQEMTVSVPRDKVVKLCDLAEGFVLKGGCTADELRSFLGRAESVRPAAELAPLHYRDLQDLMPRRRSWNGRAFLPLTQGAKDDLHWWISGFPSQCTSPLQRGPATLEMSTDASSRWGWGGTSSRGSFQGPWKGKEAAWHINLQELVAAELGLSFSSVNGYRAAIARFLGETGSEAASAKPVRRLLKGVFNRTPHHSSLL